MNKIKNVDGFVWLIVTSKAKEVFTSGLFEVYELHEDGSESLIESMDELNEVLERGGDIGIEGGHLNTRDQAKLISIDDVFAVARHIQKNITRQEAKEIVDTYTESDIDPWDIVVEDMIYNLIKNLTTTEVLSFDDNGVPVSIEFMVEGSDFWITFGDYNVHYCEDYNEICVYNDANYTKTIYSRPIKSN
jgi:hypothetical protein